MGVNKCWAEGRGVGNGQWVMGDEEEGERGGEAEKGREKSTLIPRRENEGRIKEVKVRVKRNNGREKIVVLYMYKTFR